MGYSPWGCKELDMTEWLSPAQHTPETGLCVGKEKVMNTQLLPKFSYQGWQVRTCHSIKQKKNPETEILNQSISGAH